MALWNKAFALVCIQLLLVGPQVMLVQGFLFGGGGGGGGCGGGGGGCSSW